MMARRDEMWSNRAGGYIEPIGPIRQTLDGELLLANQPETGSSAKLLKI